MLLVPTYVGPSSIEGVGVFASAEILEGTRIWRLDLKFDRLFRPEEVTALSEPERQFVERYGYTYPYDPTVTVIEMDNGRFMNHSDDPNTDFTNPDAGFALRTIAANEELTCNYGEFEPGFAMLPGRLFKPATSGQTEWQADSGI